MTITTTQLYRLLSEKVGKDTAETLTTFVEEKVKEEVQEKSLTLATQVQLAETKTEIIQRLDNHFKWLIGIMISIFGLAIAIFKL